MAGIVDSIQPLSAMESHPEYVKLYDDHTSPHTQSTTVQTALAVIWLCSFLMWVFKPRLLRWQGAEAGKELPNKTEQKSGDLEKPADGEHTKVEIQDDAEKALEKTNKENEKTFSKFKPPPNVEEVLKYVVIMGAIMYFFYLCDYLKIFPKGERIYDRDEFLFLVFLLFLIGTAFTIKTTPDVICNRDQTEEWKGWMQVMFVWYHYFGAGEWYNWIRVYIAAYVWMTGFGNFSFFWMRKDFSLWRVMKMLFRLNFLVSIICLTMDNEYMLYYICAMHTYWFLSVYATMAIFPHWNTSRYKMWLKFAIYAVCNALMFDLTDVAYVVFKPFGFLLHLHDGEHHPMHEWIFRLGLDHWVCFIGMLCAYNYPHYESFMRYLESDGSSSSAPNAPISTKIMEFFSGKQLIKLGMLAGSVTALTVWYKTVMQYEKYTYNGYHPYTSFIPIIAFIVIRNLWPTLRTHYIYLFAFLGKVTLETYLCQLHIYLQSNAKHLILYLPDYHLLNFAFATIIYLSISHKIFDLTTEFSAFLLPKKLRDVFYRFAGVGAIFTIACVVGWVITTYL